MSEVPLYAVMYAVTNGMYRKYVDRRCKRRRYETVNVSHCFIRFVPNGIETALVNALVLRESPTSSFSSLLSLQVLEVPCAVPPPPPRTLQQDYAQGPMVPLGGGGYFFERGTPVIVVVIAD